MTVRIQPGLLRGTVAAPPSKSQAHRLLLCAALSEGASRVRGVSDSQDVLATLDCISALGCHVRRNGDTVTVSGGLRPIPAGTVFPCRESGSTLRFFIPLTLVHGGSAVFTGSKRLMQRGVSVYEALFREKGIALVSSPASLTVTGQLKPGEYTVPGDVSSQFVSGLLFALPLLPGDSLLRVLPPVESRPYIRLTLDALRRFGVTVREVEENTYRIPGNQHVLPQDVTVEGDWSNAAVLLAFRALGNELTVTGLNPESAQGDRVFPALLDRLSEPQPKLDLSDCPDLAPVLFAAAAIRHGAVFTGTRRLRLKESDRAGAMSEELRKFGIRCEVEENRVTVFPGALRKPLQPLESHNDHRIVMALALLCAQTGGEIEGAEAVAKSYPDFFRTLRTLGLEIAEIP